MISSWVTEAAPCRCAVPRQSAPVSPPPMITTCLPCGVDRRVVELAERLQVAVGQVLHGQVDAGELPAGRGQVAADGGAAGQDDGVELRAQLLGRQVASPLPPTSTPVTNRVPSARIWSSRRSSTAFSILNSGMP